MAAMIDVHSCAPPDGSFQCSTFVSSGSCATKPLMDRGREKHPPPPHRSHTSAAVPGSSIEYFGFHRFERLQSRAVPFVSDAGRNREALCGPSARVFGRWSGLEHRPRSSVSASTHDRLAAPRLVHQDDPSRR